MKIKVYISLSMKPTFSRVNLQAKQFFEQRIKHKNFDIKKWWIWEFWDNSKNISIFAHIGKEITDLDQLQEFWADIINYTKKLCWKKNIEITILFEKWRKLKEKNIIQKWILLAKNEHKYFSKEKNEQKINIKWINNSEIKNIVEWIDIARELTIKPANLINPKTMSEYISNLFKKEKNIKVSIHWKSFLEKENMNLFLAVSKWNEYEPKMVCIDYNPTWKNEKPTILIWKWLTYDSWWLYMKPAPHMNEMNWDMWWSATVVWILHSLNKLGIKKRVIWIVWLTENLVNEKSYKNWDVIKAKNWKYVYIWHTDAEWRLVLADLLSYAEEKYKPKFIFDFATLTWACISALWEMYTWLLWYNQKQINKLQKIWKSVNDLTRQLPLDKRCSEAITDDKHADLSNISSLRWMLWSSTAWAFLAEFIENKNNRIHCDIAWTSLRTKMKRSYDPSTWAGTWAMIHTIIEYLK